MASASVNIYILSYPQAMASAVYGVHDLFQIANQFTHPAEFQVHLISKQDTPEPQENSILFIPPPLGQGGVLPQPQSIQEAIHYWLSKNAVITATCASVFWLAESGLLNGRMATTHWRLFDRLEKAYPKIKAVDRRQMVVDEGNVITAAGLYAFQDLTLHLIARFSSYHVAKQVADYAMLDMNGRLQNYYQRFMPDYQHGDRVVLNAQRYCQKQPVSALGVRHLADAVNVTERTLNRRFQRALAMSPSHYLQQLRIDDAKLELEYPQQSLEQIADRIGYSDVRNFIRAFKNVTGLTPSEYRQRQRTNTEIPILSNITR
ncbi:MAG: helix-turn-helix domain-containing protein [Reinekea sp.]